MAVRTAHDVWRGDIVMKDLRSLRGPISGVMELPLRLFWISPRSGELWAHSSTSAARLMVRDFDGRLVGAVTSDATLRATRSDAWASRMERSRI